MGTEMKLLYTGKMKFNALGLGFNHLERAKQFLKWEWSFSLFTISFSTILFDTNAQKCLFFEIKEMIFCTSRPQKKHWVMPVFFCIQLAGLVTSAVCFRGNNMRMFACDRDQNGV